MARDKRWTPVRRGALYCSPGCGLPCTWADFKRAARGAAALAEHLGPGWKPRVWENLGWHFEAVLGEGHLNVSPSLRGRSRRYTAYLSRTPGPGGHWVEHRSTARAAVRAVIDQAEAEAFTILGVVAEART